MSVTRRRGMAGFVSLTCVKVLHLNVRLVQDDERRVLEGDKAKSL